MSANFVVLINGSPSSVFNATKGLRWGCPLSPLLFLLAIEALSKNDYFSKKTKGKLKVLRCQNLFLTHLLLVDDVLILGEGSAEKWDTYSGIFSIFFLPPICKLFNQSLVFITIMYGCMLFHMLRNCCLIKWPRWSRSYIIWAIT